jgi:hypothetical protein
MSVVVAVLAAHSMCEVRKLECEGEQCGRMGRKGIERGERESLRESLRDRDRGV